MRSRFNRTSEVTERSRQLRRDMTDVEKKLWQSLRGGKIEGVSFRKQHPIGPYVVDSCAPAVGLIVELDGGQHAEPARQQKHGALTAWLELQGFLVLRFWNNDVMGNFEGVLESIAVQLRERCETIPTPPSPFHGEG